MLDIRFVRENPELVKENIRKKFQDEKLLLVDECIALDAELRKVQQEADDLRAKRNKLSKEIGGLMAKGLKEEAEKIKAEVSKDGDLLDQLSAKQTELSEELTKKMMIIPQMVDPSVPVGKDDSENVELQRFGEPKVPDFEVPYHRRYCQTS